MSRLQIPARTDPRLRRKIPILTLKPGEDLRAIILGEDLPVTMHWDERKFRSIPCRTDRACPYCPEKPQINFFMPILRGVLRNDRFVFSNAILFVPSAALDLCRAHVRSGVLFLRRKANDYEPFDLWKTEPLAGPLTAKAFDVAEVLDEFFFGPAPAQAALDTEDRLFEWDVPAVRAAEVQAPAPARRAAEGGAS